MPPHAVCNHVPACVTFNSCHSDVFFRGTFEYKSEVVVPGLISNTCITLTLVSEHEHVNT